MPFQFTHSIRWRLQLWLAFLLVGLLTGFAIAVYQLQKIKQLAQIDDALEQRVAALLNDVRTPPPFEGPPGPARRGENPVRPMLPDHGPAFSFPRQFRKFLEDREIQLSTPTRALFNSATAEGFYYAIWSPSGNVLKQSTNAPANLSRPGGPRPPPQTNLRTRDSYREAFHFTELGDCVLVGRSIVGDLAAMRRFALWLIVTGGTVLALGLGGVWWLASQALRPLEDISATATRISAGNLSERINVAETDNELGRVARILNSTFARLETAFRQQKQFTADASHELRTPLAVLISETQTTLARERSAAEYRETVEACLDTAQQMRGLIESLLELARCDSDGEAIKRAPLDLAEIAHACVERLRPLAAKRDIQIHVDLAPAKILGNASQINQVVTNLLTNAIHYNRSAGEIRIATGVENAAAFLTVANTGAGISAEDLPHIFERFYRADKSRSRAEGRTGLGLAICKAIVEAHGGHIDVSSEFGVGATFTVRIPF